jgi:hypothetical protein
MAASASRSPTLTATSPFTVNHIVVRRIFRRSRPLWLASRARPCNVSAPVERESLRGPLSRPAEPRWSGEVFELERLGNNWTRAGRDALSEPGSLEHGQQTVALEGVGVGP